MSINESLAQLVTLTSRNVQILSTLNEAFFSSSTYVTTQVDGQTYTLPSFITIENKLNRLQTSWDALVKACSSGDAWFNYDGNTREICLGSLQVAPSPLTLSKTENFYVDTSTFLKDLLTPTPSVRIPVSGLPLNVRSCVVKKIVALTSTAKSTFESIIGANNASVTTSYTAFMSDISTLTRDEDYTEYDKVYDMPVRSGGEWGDYYVKSVDRDYVSGESSFAQYLVITLHDTTTNTSPLTVFSTDSTKVRQLNVGDYLTTYDGSCRMEITEINYATSTLTVMVTDSAYTNIQGTQNAPTQDTNSVPDNAHLRYLTSLSDEDRYIYVPLEEDEWIALFVAPVIERTHTRSGFGTGLAIHTYNLTHSSGTDFYTYYSNYVKNIGDMLAELACVVSDPVTKYSSDQYTTLTQTKPSLTTDTLKVVQINKHLNDDTSIQDIKSYYAQKKQAQTQYNNISTKIASIRSDLASVNYDDTSGIKSMYEAQIATLSSELSTINASITSLTDSIANVAASADVPIEDAKYRIRGYLDISEFLKSIGDLGVTKNDVLRVETQYSYANAYNPTSNIDIIGEDYVFTDKSTYEAPLTNRSLEYNDGVYKTTTHIAENNENDVKYNQIEIPITQGEIVKLRSRVVWRFGYPYAKVTSDWSDYVIVEFPDEYKTNISVTTIIEENNNDIVTNHFNSILESKGIVTHVSASIQDQDITYFHNASDIASGQYTAERRVIPLKDLLSTFKDDISSLKSEIEGTRSNAIEVSIIYNNNITTLTQSVKNVITLKSYDKTTSVNGAAVETLALRIKNVSGTTVNLYSIVPGARTNYIQSCVLRDGSLGKYKASDYFAETYTAIGTPLEQCIARAQHFVSYLKSDYIKSRYRSTWRNYEAPAPGASFGKVLWRVRHWASCVYLKGDIKSTVSESVTSVTTVDDLLTALTKLTTGTKYVTTEYTDPTSYDHVGPMVFVWGEYGVRDDDDDTWSSMQRANQFITFRQTNPYDGTALSSLKCSAQCGYWNAHLLGLSSSTDNNKPSEKITNALYVTPYVHTTYGACINSDDVMSSYSLAPDASVIIPMCAMYVISNNSVDYELGFDIRNSLYGDPIFYDIKFIANKTETAESTIASSVQVANDLTRYGTVVR